MSGVYRASGREALCCECGNVRKIDGRLRHQNHQTEELDDNPDRWRMTAVIKCQNCGRRTTHALLRLTHDPNRDEAERPVTR